MAYLKRSTATVTTRTEDNIILDTPALGTPASGVVTNLSGVLPVGVTGGSGLTALGTVATGNITDTDILFPDGHIVKITVSSFNTTTDMNPYTGLDYNENMTTTNTHKPASLDHTVQTTNPRFHNFCIVQVGGSAYGGTASVHVGMFGDDTFLTSVRQRVDGVYTDMASVGLNKTVDGDGSYSGGNNFELALRAAMSNIFSTAGSMNGRIVGFGHSGFDSNLNHPSQLMVMEEQH